VEEVWDQIGKRLREAREAADLAVDDIVFRTRIPRSVVEALEAEDFSVFTSPTYAKSFLRQYSEYLKVDAEPWLDALEPASYVGGEAWQPMFSGGEPTLPAAKRPVRDPRMNEQADSSRGNQWSAAWLMIITVGLVVGVVKGYQFLENKFGQEDAPKAAEVKPAAAPQEAPSPAKPAPQTAPAAQAEAPVPIVPPVNAPAVAIPQVSHTGAEAAPNDPPNGNPPRALIIRE